MRLPAGARQTSRRGRAQGEHDRLRSSHQLRRTHHDQVSTEQRSTTGARASRARLACAHRQPAGQEGGHLPLPRTRFEAAWPSPSPTGRGGGAGPLGPRAGVGARCVRSGLEVLPMLWGVLEGRGPCSRSVAVRRRWGPCRGWSVSGVGVSRELVKTSPAPGVRVADVQLLGAPPSDGAVGLGRDRGGGMGNESEARSRARSPWRGGGQVPSVPGPALRGRGRRRPLPGDVGVRAVRPAAARAGSSSGVWP